MIRATTEQDWEILREIRMASLLDAPTAFGTTYAAAAANTEAQWRERAAGRGPGRFVLAFADRAAVGLAGAVVNAAGEFGLIAMWVRPEYRGAGVAANLVESIKQNAIDRGYSRVALDVAVENKRATAFYKKLGFEFLPVWEALESHPQITVQKMEWIAQGGAGLALA
ncbi:GNAT family N-acetyltransferase [Massilia soli]|uniref:GNAT family N-acetyltransferase n=1 Tax=Massilia soli TaxID=2792854 RepID=A0ABS7SVP9_9BURK|nr:GNAT family N-acetyltransferase [Massilia soli]MBZ2209987.1 GNAT family N-acetyltransferase [Massilia soli]